MNMYRIWLVILVCVVTLLAILLVGKPVKAWHILAPIIAGKAAAGGGAIVGGGGGAAAGAGAIGGGAAVVGVLIYIDVKHRTRCNLSRSTWVDGRNDINPTYKPWRDECKKRQRDPNTVRARG